MSDPLVLASHLPDEGHYQSDLYKVWSVLCDGDLAYSQGIAKHWDHPAPLVLIEHDVEVTDAHITRLLECNYPICAQSYPLHWITTGHVVDEYPHKNNGIPVTYGTEWADWSAPGFIKISPESRIAPLAECHWRHVEQAINDAVTGPVHIHWPPVPHHHF